MSNETENKPIPPKTKRPERKNWHRGVDMSLKPLFHRKRYDSTPEVDVSQ